MTVHFSNSTYDNMFVPRLIKYLYEKNLFSILIYYPVKANLCLTATWNNIIEYGFFCNEHVQSM